MKNVFHYEIEGSFGDKKVLIDHVIPGSGCGVTAVLFHGVHGCCSYREGNKYRDLADQLLKKKAEVFLVETSRMIRDRDAYGTDRESWAIDSFTGKTYAQDLLDNCNALHNILETFQQGEVILWGFSLGGINAINILGGEYKAILSNSRLEYPELDPGLVNTLVVSGSGDKIRDEAASSLSMPVISTIGPSEELHEAASNIIEQRVFFFYGDQDRTFSEGSSRRVFEKIASPNKDFIIITGADHSFRQMNGVPSNEGLSEMVECLEKRGIFH
ncbi:MAG: alpha/beta hydrolase [Synergistales bacterium]|nr:alpha/beta hydrolase [Synergistales bacterium]